MDDDCFPEEDALYNLEKAHMDLGGAYGWLSSKCLWTDGNLCNMNVQRKDPFKDIDMAGEGLLKAELASFVSLFVTADTVKKYGYPISDFFIWGDDWEYTRRISLEQNCYVVPASRVIHAMASNTVVSIAEDSHDRMNRYRYAYRNDVYIYRREGLLGWVWIICKNTWHTLKVLIKPGNNKFEKISIIWRGFINGMKFRPQIEYM